jgi:hypothetical protein
MDSLEEEHTQMMDNKEEVGLLVYYHGIVINCLFKSRHLYFGMLRLSLVMSHLEIAK